ncbi:cingulin-like protein 1 [Peromyscus californicus insignis]|uniref:cingulin-like protein 1 n=1 Tax=Peromyscus californicus insignis TaxID=564181 RepID=UPI0022A71D8E|nr:cingulin-like protein 1 [Peromyscus californicus insignis]XP_052569758.1 cingulin-like protein 1 [Peromyscus californicus insignis]XP_052569768.1 cingulin-like protein 1 [Peromyscus californicus insignis]
MELYFGEYQHVQQEYGVHLRLASDDTPKPRNSQPSKAGSYGVSIRVQGIDGHPYIVLNNTERCLAGMPFPENGPAFPSSMINNLSLHPSNGTGLKENRPEELQFPENPYLQTSPMRNQKQSSLHEGRNGVVERKDGPPKLPHVLNFQKHPELLQPYDPEKNEVNSEKHHPPESPWLRNAPEEGTNHKKPRNYFPKPCSSQPNSPTLEDVAKTNTTAIRLCSSVVIEDPQKQTSVCVNVQRCAKEGAGEEALSPRRKSPTTPSPQAYSETKKSRPDVLPFRRQDSAGPILDGARSRRSSSSSTTPTSATSLYRFLLDDQECAIHADNVNRHENRRYIPFLPGTGRDIDTCSIPGVDQLIEKFDQKPGLQRRGRSGKRNRINPDDRKRSRSVDSAFPFGLQGNTEYLTEFSRNLGKSSEHLLRPSQVFPQRSQAPEHRGKHSPSSTLAKLQGTTQGAHPKPPLQNKDGKALNKGSQESVVACASSLPAPNKKEEEIKIATATLMLQNRAVAATPDSGAKKISVKTFPSDSNTQATPDLLKGQQELTQQTNEETAKQILYNYLKEGSTDNEDATKRKVNLVFEKIQTLKSRAAGSAQGNNQVSNFSSEVKDLLEQKNKLILEVSELQRQLQLETKNHQNIKEERERMRKDLEELRGRHQSQVEETAALQRRLGETEDELRKNLEELFQVKMEREQHQTEIRDLQDQLSEMHDELDSTKRSEDREKGALIEELLQAKRDLQDLLIAKEEQEDLLRKRERELTALKGALKEEVSSHDQEMDKLKEQYDAELQALRESVEEATKNVEVLASRSSSSEQNQADADLREKALKEENGKLQGRIVELERRVAQLQRQVEDVKRDEAQAKETLRKSESEVQQLEGALVHARQEEKEATSARRALEKELESAQRALSQTAQEQKELLEKLQDETEQKEQLRKLKNEMESERWHLDKTIEKLQKEMADIAEASRTSSLELQKQLGEYKEKNRRELAEMQTQLKEKSLEVEKARLAAGKMQDELRLKEEELRDYQRAEDEALTERQLLEQSLKDLEYELEAKSHLRDDRSRLLKQMEDKVAQLEIELEEERTSADLLSERITWSREQMEQMRSELLQEKAAKQDLECDKISLERQNKDLKSRIIHLEGSYRSSKEGLVVQMEARIAELEDRLESEERDRANLQLNNRRLERKVKELVMQVDDEHLSLTDQKDQLSLRLKAMKRQVEEAEEEIDRLESSKKKLQRELEDQIGVNEQLQGQLNSMKKGLRLKTLPSKVLDDSDDDDLSSDGGSLYEAPLSYSFPKDSTITSQI